jgi:RND superfamily putative drug exporter
VALGIARTGRVVTAAAVVMSISFAALIAAEVSFMRMFGLGLTLAVLADATLVRMVLMPAFMHVMGEWNWWAPKWLSRIHDRFGLDHGGGVKTRDHSSVAGATKGARSELRGPLNEEVVDVVSTIRRIS